MARGKKTGGRAKGTRNKTTATIKESVLRCFASIGGEKAFAAWAKEHPTEFYTKVAPRLIPLEVGGPDDGPLPLRIELTDVAAPPSDPESRLS